MGLLYVTFTSLFQELDLCSFSKEFKVTSSLILIR